MTNAPPLVAGIFSLLDSFRTFDTLRNVTVVNSSLVICGFSALAFFYIEMQNIDIEKKKLANSKTI